MLQLLGTRSAEADALLWTHLPVDYYGKARRLLLWLTGVSVGDIFPAETPRLPGKKQQLRSQTERLVMTLLRGPALSLRLGHSRPVFSFRQETGVLATVQGTQRGQRNQRVLSGARHWVMTAFPAPFSYPVALNQRPYEPRVMFNSSQTVQDARSWHLDNMKTNS